MLGNVATNEAYISLALFIYLPVLLTVFAITRVDAWAGDEEEGRLEILASLPLPRWQILAAHYLAVAAGLWLILLLIGTFALTTGALAGVNLDSGRMVGALFATFPLALLVAAFGLCVATWQRRPLYAIPITGALVAIMFVFGTVAPIFDLPDWARSLSISHLYGKPLTEGIHWEGLFTLSAAALVFAALSMIGIERRDSVK